MTTALSEYPSRRSRNEFRTILIGWIITDQRFSNETFACPNTTQFTRLIFPSEKLCLEQNIYSHSSSLARLEVEQLSQAHSK